MGRKEKGSGSFSNLDFFLRAVLYIKAGYCRWICPWSFLIWIENATSILYTCTLEPSVAFKIRAYVKNVLTKHIENALCVGLQLVLNENKQHLRTPCFQYKGTFTHIWYKSLQEVQIIIKKHHSANDLLTMDIRNS